MKPWPSDQHRSLPPAPCTSLTQGRLILLTARQTPPLSPAVIRQVQRLWVLPAWICRVARGLGTLCAPAPVPTALTRSPNPPSTPSHRAWAPLPSPDRFLPARCDPHGAGAARPHLEVSNSLGLVPDVSRSLITGCGRVFPSRNWCFLASALPWSSHRQLPAPSLHRASLSSNKTSQWPQGTAGLSSAFIYSFLCTGGCIFYQGTPGFIPGV